MFEIYKLVGTDRKIAVEIGTGLAYEIIKDVVEDSSHKIFNVEKTKGRAIHQNNWKPKKKNILMETL